jgi:hypothetical protein
MASLKAEYVYRGAKVRRETVVVDGESTYRWRGRVRINNTTFASVAGDSKEEVEARIAKFLDRAE